MPSLPEYVCVQFADYSAMGSGPVYAGIKGRLDVRERV